MIKTYEIKSGPEKTSKIYHIKNLETQNTKIEVIKKISEHPNIIYEKNIPFKKSSQIKTIKIFDKKNKNKYWGTKKRTFSKWRIYIKYSRYSHY